MTVLFWESPNVHPITGYELNSGTCILLNYYLAIINYIIGEKNWQITQNTEIVTLSESLLLITFPPNWDSYSNYVFIYYCTSHHSI